MSWCSGMTRGRQLRHDVLCVAFWYATGSFVVDLGEQVVDLQPIAKTGYVARDGAVAEADDDFAALADLLGELDVVHVGDCALDECDVDVFGKFLGVGNGTVDEVGQREQINQLLVQVQETHVTAGTTAEPGGRQAEFL